MENVPPPEALDMSHPSRLIRHRLQAILAGQTIAESRIFTNRDAPIAAPLKLGPVLLIYDRLEDSEIFEEAPRQYLHHLRVGIELVVPDMAAGDHDDMVDDLAHQVRLILYKDRSLRGCAEDVTLEETEGSETHQGETLVGSKRQTWKIDYLETALEGDPTDCRPLEAVTVEWRFPPPDGSDLHAQDEIAP